MLKRTFYWAGNDRLRQHNFYTVKVEHDSQLRRSQKMFSEDCGTQYWTTRNIKRVAHFNALTVFNSDSLRWSARLTPKVCARYTHFWQASHFASNTPNNTIRLICFLFFFFFLTHGTDTRINAVFGVTFNFLRATKRFLRTGVQNTKVALTSRGLSQITAADHGTSQADVLAAFDWAPLAPCRGIYAPLKYPGRHAWLGGVGGRWWHHLWRKKKCR